MGKYEPLARYLKAMDADSWVASFTKIEQILGSSLPRSAYEHQAWWANQSGGGHSQTRGWAEAGFETRELDLSNRRVRFERTDNALPPSVAVPDRISSELWARAQAVSGIVDRNQLIEAALEALIQSETSRYFTALGGSMPDAEAAPRRQLGQ